MFATLNYDYLKKGNHSFQEDLTFSYLGGVAGGAADGLGSYASTVGIGGVATMLTGTCTFFQTIIEYFFFEAIYSTLDYIILVVAFTTVVFTALHE